jgi:hypothetical protein
MMNTTTPERPKNSFFNSWMLRFCWALIAIVPLLIIIFLVWRVKISHKVDAKLHALTQAGYPTSAAELEQMYYPPIADKENGALFFIEAFNRMDLSTAAKDKLFTLSQNPSTNTYITFSPEESNVITRATAPNHELLDQLRNRTNWQTCRYPIDLKMGFETLLPHLAKIKTTMILLTLEATLDGEGNKTQESVDDLNAAFRLAHSLSEEPIIISQLVRMSSHRLIVRSLEHTLSHQQLTDEQLLSLARSFQQAETPLAYEHALAGELCSGIMIFQMSAQQLIDYAKEDDTDEEQNSKPAAGRAQPIRGNVLQLSGFTPRDFNFYLGAMTDQLTNSKLPFPQRLDATFRSDDQISTNAAGHYYVFSSLFIHSCGGLVEKTATDIASANIAQTVLAIERYRLIHQDQLPENLAALSPALLPVTPSDPFDGQPLRYKKLSPGYVVYSVGRDRKDDGGVEIPSTKPHAPKDITLTVRR